MTDAGVVEDEYGGSSRGAGGLGCLVHLCGGHRTVVEQDQGVGQLLWVAGVGVGCEVEEQVVYPGAEGRRGAGFDAVGCGFGGGVHEGAAAVGWLSEQGADDVVDGQDPPGWGGGGFDSGPEPLGPPGLEMC